MLTNYSFNSKAVEIIENKLRPFQKQLQIYFHTYPNGANVIDMGVHQPAGFLAAKYLTEISLGGLGKLSFGKTKIDDLYFATANIFVDLPLIAELSSHCAIWRAMHCGVEKNFSGPARAAVKDDYSKIANYTDEGSGKAVLVYQINYLPGQSLVDELIKKCDVKPENFYLIVARTGTLTGTVQVAARNVEQTLPTLVDKNFPMHSVVQAMGTAPIVAVTDDEDEAYGRVNDALIYGQETSLWVNCDDEEITKILPILCMNQEGNDEIYGLPFKEIFARCNKDWCQLPRHWDAPSKVNFFNLRTGRTFVAGKHSKKALTAAFMGQKGCYIK